MQKCFLIMNLCVWTIFFSPFVRSMENSLFQEMTRDWENTAYSDSKFLDVLKNIITWKIDKFGTTYFHILAKDVNSVKMNQFIKDCARTNYVIDILGALLEIPDVELKWGWVREPGKIQQIVAYDREREFFRGIQERFKNNLLDLTKFNKDINLQNKS